MNRNSWLWTAATIAVVAIVHVIPMAASYAHRGSTLVTCDVTEEQYLLLITAAYRGDSLSNPYLAGHQNSPRYLPEMVERSLAAVARLTRLPPLTVVAISRLAFPVGIALLILNLGRRLALSEGAAALAALLATIGDPRAWVRVFDPSWVAFPRYFRAVSPGAHVFLFLLALLAVERLRSEPKWRTAVPAGIALAVLFYTPLFYWTTALAGTVWLALGAAPPANREAKFAWMAPKRLLLWAALGIAAIGAIPYARQAASLATDPTVHETLARRELLTPGRALDTIDGDARPVFCAGLIFLALAIALLRGQPVFAFLMPFLTAATLLVWQNALTNRHLQSHHWVNCLIPLWALLIAAAIELTLQRRVSPASAAIPLIFGVIAAASLATVSVSAIREQSRPPTLYPLDTMMPGTIQWLRSHTPPRSVVFCARPFAADLLLFTANKIYWGGQADYFALSDSEFATRESDQESWTPQGGGKLHYPADYYLGASHDCPADSLYANRLEDTCILGITP
jgi:hypothetical protein